MIARVIRSSDVVIWPRRWRPAPPTAMATAALPAASVNSRSLWFLWGWNGIVAYLLAFKVHCKCHCAIIRQCYALRWHLIEAGPGLGETTPPSARCFRSKPKSTSEAGCTYWNTHTCHFGLKNDVFNVLFHSNLTYIMKLAKNKSKLLLLNNKSPQM